MENLADISVPKVPPNNQRDQKIQSSICLFSFNRRKAIETEKTDRKLIFLLIFRTEISAMFSILGQRERKQF